MTKTKNDYTWLLPPEADKLVTAINDINRPGYDGFEALNDSLRSYYTTQVLNKANVDTNHTDERMYNLRSMRAFRATEWLMLVTEYKIMGWDPEPPNPL